MKIKQGETKGFVFYTHGVGSDTPILDAPADMVFTAIKEGQCCEAVKLTKKLNAGISFNPTTGQYTLQFEPNDTINLPSGNYAFDIKLKRGDKQYFIIGQGYLKIEKSYTGVI